MESNPGLLVGFVCGIAHSQGNPLALNKIGIKMDRIWVVTCVQCPLNQELNGFLVVETVPLPEFELEHPNGLGSGCVQCRPKSEFLKVEVYLNPDPTWFLPCFKV